MAEYAIGHDYHQVLKVRLQFLLQQCRELFPPLADSDPLDGRIYVDTGPLLERELATRAGLGWTGKNTCLLNRSEGSFTFLAAMILNRDLPPDRPTTAHCGNCTRCLTACPTQAFVGPYVLDSRRCISYLTIELRGPIPRELRAGIGPWIFGCDICQDVCPWNRKAPRTTDPAWRARQGLPWPELIPLLRLTQPEFSRRFRGSPIKRATWRGFLRNVCVALGNSGHPEAIPPLQDALSHPEPLVRGHAAWALGQLQSIESLGILDRMQESEPDLWVRREVRDAAEQIRSTRQEPTLKNLPDDLTPL